MKEAAEQFRAFVSANAERRFVVTTHKKADIDGLASAYAITTVFKRSILSLPDEPDFGAKELAKKLGISYSFLKDLNQNEFDGLIVIDTSSYDLLKEAQKWHIACLVDHHHDTGNGIKADIKIIDEDAPSTAEMIYKLLPEVNKKSAFGLAAGIVSDTARFKNGRTETFAILAELMKKAGVEYNELLLAAEPELPIDTKVALIKGCQRVQYVISKGLLIVTSDVEANESDTASLLIEAADVAFVASWKKEENETRISARARKHVNVQLNEVMKDVGESFGGAGGGHPKAAGASAKAKPDEVLKRCVELFLEKG